MDIKRQRTKKNWGRIVLYVFCGLVFFYLMLPVFIVVPLSFSASNYLEFPPKGFSLQWYEAYFNDRIWLSATFLSLRVAFFPVLVASVLGTLAAFGIVRGNYPGKSALNAFVTSPMIVPVIIFAVAVYGIFSKFQLIGSTLGLVAAHSVLAIPFVLNAVSGSLRTLDPSLEQAAQSLGASKFTTFFKVVFPLIRPGVLSGALFAFIISFDELIVSMFIAGVNYTLPVKMFSDIRTEINPTIAAVSTILMAITTIVLLGSALFTSKRDKKI